MLLAQSPAKVPMPDLSALLQVFWTFATANWWITLVLVFMVAVAIMLPDEKKRRRSRAARLATAGVDIASSAPGEFRATAGLLTVAEAAFLPVLRQAAGADKDGGPQVMAKVRLADIAMPPGSSPTWQADFNRVCAKHVDFVVVAGDRMLPLRVVELDDSSHERGDRVERDALVDEVLRRAGIPVTHVPWRRKYDVAVVRGMMR